MEFIEYVKNNSKDDFSKKEIKKIESIINKSIQEYNTNNEQQQETSKIENKAAEKFFTTLAERPESIKEWIAEFKKPNWYKFGFKICVALIVVVPITFLSSTGVLQTCETATLFGGIVGYLLGYLN